jgi:DNA-directed RNA polymerase specialized sigma54-like protein
MSSERLNRELVKAYVDHRIAQIEKTLGDKIDKLSQNVEKLIEFNPTGVMVRNF